MQLVSFQEIKGTVHPELSIYLFISLCKLTIYIFVWTIPLNVNRLTLDSLSFQIQDSNGKYDFTNLFAHTAAMTHPVTRGQHLSAQRWITVKNQMFFSFTNPDVCKNTTMFFTHFKFSVEIKIFAYILQVLFMC